MNRTRYSSLLFGLLALSLILFGIPLNVLAYHSGSESDLAANPELVTFRNYGGGSVDKLALISSYRVSDSSVLKVDSVRWSALGTYYVKLAKVRAADSDSARWAAIGSSYIARARAADASRWAGLGDYYSSRALAANPELCVVSNYKDLAANPELLTLQQYKTSVC
jgi:hypothetical protein